MYEDEIRHYEKQVQDKLGVEALIALEGYIKAIVYDQTDALRTELNRAINRLASEHGANAECGPTKGAA